ncbi:hypothetical protein [Sorangium sp. So ce204]|uniref:hypothetical protein n=1 Tax=Sorangium sp. So ce204 TaxID=3133288 RepID=UPI003F5F88E1
MSRAPVDAPAETAAELPTATEAALLEMVLGLPGVGPRILGTAALPSLGRLSPAALAERTQIALFDATRLAAAFELGRRYHAVRARRGALLTDAARVARYFGPRHRHAQRPLRRRPRGCPRGALRLALAARCAPPPARCAPVHPARHLQRTAPASSPPHVRPRHHRRWPGRGERGCSSC